MTDENALQALNAAEAALRERLANLKVTNPATRQLMEVATNADVPLLGQAMSTLEKALWRQSVVDMIDVIATSTYSETQVRAILVGQMLLRSKSLGFAHFEVTYKLLRTIRDENLAAVHPAGYIEIVGGEDRSFMRMAQETAKMSPSQISDIMQLGDIIFPYLEDNLNLSRYQIWERVGQSNLRMMIPLLRLLINEVVPEPEQRTPQQRIVRRADEITLRAIADDQGITIDVDPAVLAQLADDEQRAHLEEIEANRVRVRDYIRTMPAPARINTTVAWLLARGEDTAVNFARVIGTREDNPFPAYVFKRQGTVLMAAPMTTEQWENLLRILRQRIEPYDVEDVNDLLRHVTHHDD